MSDEEEKPSFEKLKTLVTVPEVAELYGFDVQAGDKIISPFNPSERTPSCHLYEDHWFDFSTGKGGDAVDLVKAFDPEQTNILWKLWHRALKAGHEIGDVERQEPRHLDCTRLTTLWNETRGGRTEEWEDHLGVKFIDYKVKVVDGVLWVAHGCAILGVYGIKYRSMDGRKWSEPGSQFTKRLYYPRGWFTRDDDDRPPKDKAIICEGESDCWALDYRLGHRADVFALPSGAQSWKNHWVSDLRRYGAVYLCLDNDSAGETARNSLHRKLGSQALDLRVPDGFKDAREACRAGWAPSLT